VEHCLQHNIKIKKEDLAPEERSVADERHGIYRRDGVRTQHFKRAGLQTMLEKRGFFLLSSEKVEYDWSTELSPPTEFLHTDPPPFDWLVLCEKVDVHVDVHTQQAPQIAAKRAHARHKPPSKTASRLDAALAFSGEADISVSFCSKQGSAKAGPTKASPHATANSRPPTMEMGKRQCNGLDAS
jgi:hypothetical protein